MVAGLFLVDVGLGRIAEARPKGILHSFSGWFADGLIIGPENDRGFADAQHAGIVAVEQPVKRGAITECGILRDRCVGALLFAETLEGVGVE